MTETSISAEQLQQLLAEHGSKAAVARHLGRSESTVKDWYRQAQTGTVRQRKASKGLLTREHLIAALQPPNNCRVKLFLESLADDQREIVEEALGYDRQDLAASRLRQLLIDAGYDERDVPGVDAINAHRSGTRPCRCKG